MQQCNNNNGDWLSWHSCFIVTFRAFSAVKSQKLQLQLPVAVAIAIVKPVAIAASI